MSNFDKSDVKVITMMERPNVAPGEYDLRVIGLVRWIVQTYPQPPKNRETGELLICEHCSPEELSTLETERLPYAHTHPVLEAFGWLDHLQNAYTFPDDYEVWADQKEVDDSKVIGSLGMHHKPVAKPHVMNDDEKRAYAEQLLRERYPEPKTAGVNIL